MNKTKIEVSTLINSEASKVWDYYTNPKHIIHWNFADPDWHCPSAENDLRVGGTYKARMEARDKSFGFDFEAVYSEITEKESFTYEFGGREATVHLNDLGKQTELRIIFEAEAENPVEMQKNGWQLILDNFKNYTENN